MTTEQFLSDPALITSWNASSKSEIVKLVIQAMDESAPIYGGVPEVDKESESFRLGFQRGYAFYHKKLQELATLPVVMPVLKRTYGVK